MSVLTRHDLVIPSGFPLGLDSAVDTFTDADGTFVDDHFPSGGGCWKQHLISLQGTLGASNTAHVVIDNNKVHQENNSNFRLYYHSAIPIDADYDVSCDIILRSDNNLASAGPVARLALLSSDYYFVRYNSNGNVWQLFSVVANGNPQTTLGSVGQDLTIDQVYRCTLRCLGATISLIVDGIEIISVTDATISAKGRAGFRIQQLETATVGIHLDNWIAVANNG